MNFADLTRMSDQEALNRFNSIPAPSYPESINTDPDRIEDILRDFNARQTPQEDREALRADLIRVKGYSPASAN
jgi:hypothetical protein